MQTKDPLRILSICHYIMGGFELLFGSIYIIFIVIGIVMVAKPDAVTMEQGTPEAGGVIFIIIGAVVVFVFWLVGILTILSGRFISRRTNKTFSLVVAAFNLILFPFGTALGVFDFIMLSKPDVKAEYASALPPGR